MKATDLRIGNLIYYGQQINDVDINDLSELSYSDGRSNIYSPIELTEQWLLDFGFYKNGIYFIKSLPFIGEIRITESREWGSNKFQRFYISQSDLTINYIHELQNLYFALTREELQRVDG